MSRNVMLATAEALAKACRENRSVLDTLYDPACVSVEAAAMGAMPAEAHGLDAIRGKHAWWEANFEVHSASVDGPFPHGDDRFALVFETDATDKTSRRRIAMKEVAVYTVGDGGKIVREEFFYPS